MSYAQLQHVGSLPFFPSCLSWCITADGTVLFMSGPAEEDFGEEVARVRGQNYRTAFAGEPEALRLVERALSGETLAEMTRAWGARWYNEVRPQYDRNGLVGVVGVSLPAPRAAAEPEREPDGTHTWIVREAIRGQGVHWRPGDVIRYDGRTILHADVVETAPGLTLLRRHAARLQYLLPPDASTPAPPAVDSAAAEAPRPSLRLIP